MSEIETVTVDPSAGYRLIHPMHTVLVSCVGKDNNSNIITLAWVMPTSIEPPLVAISVSPQRYSHTLIEETGEFVINVPTTEYLKELLFCGRRSGRNHDKFEETALTPLPAKKVKAPIIRECPSHLECKLRDKLVTGDHTLFIGEVVKAYTERGIFTNQYDLEKVKMVFHLGGDDFATLDPEIFTPEL
ncbi:MAG: flavin reductase family protein [Thermoproteota archaeon]